MSFDFNNEIPIYIQIIDHIKMLIINRTYLPNQRIPSVRELSIEYEVNPNTIQKALTELEEMGLIYTERTNGKYITDNEKIIEKIKEQTISEIIDNFYESMSNIGIDKKEILKILNNKEKL